jgi:hypothetical protein
MAKGDAQKKFNLLMRSSTKGFVDLYQRSKMDIEGIKACATKCGLGI